MASDGYWRYSDASRHPAAMAAAAAAAAAPPSAAPMKRSRSEYGDMPTGNDMHGYYRRDEGTLGHHAIRDTESINNSYELYLRNGISSYASGEPARPGVAGITSYLPNDIPKMGVRDGWNSGLGAGRPEAPVHLPVDASNTLFVEGLPADCTRREASHIFRPFVGFREVRLVNKESRRPGGDTLVLCFVDFENTNQAAIALDALQGYKFDEHDKESANLRLQFARAPGPRAGGVLRGRR